MAIIRNNSGKGSGFLIGVPIPAKRTPIKEISKISCGAGILRQAQYKSGPLIIQGGTRCPSHKIG
jgi:hypothetical protein